MAKPITIPNTFASATSAIPLSQLDQDFSTLANSTNDLATYSNYVADTGAADAFIANYPANTNTSSLTTGLRLQFKAANANTGASTLNVQVNGASIGTASIRLTDGSALPANTIIAGALVDVMYDGTNFQIMNDPSGGQEIISNLTLSGNLTVAGTSTFTGNVTGNVVNTTTSTITNLTSGNVTITGGSIDNISITNLTSLTVDGNTTLGDASGDTLTINGTTVTTPNGLNFDSNTLVIDAANNRVGVGTSTPANKLEIRQASNGKAWSADGDDVFAVENSGSTNIDIRSADSGGNYILFSDASARAVGWILYNHNTDSLAFRTNSAERMRITSTGNVGIGTTSPSYKLQVTNATGVDTEVAVSNSAGLARYGTRGGGNAFAGSFTAGTGFEFWSAGLQRMTIDSSGNVGIGTSSPTYKLEVFHSASGIQNAIRAYNDNSAGGTRLTATAENVAISMESFGSTYASSGVRFASSGLIQANGSGGLWINTANAAAPIIFATGGSASTNERMRIDSSGNVGIGTTAPAGKLDVAQGNSYVSTFLNSTGAYAWYFNKSRGTTVGTNTIVASGDTLGGTIFNGADGTGYIEAAKIIAQVDGTPGTNDMPGRLLFYTTADGAASGTERMRIDSNGNVGIGTSSPSARLHISNAGLAALWLSDTGEASNQKNWAFQYGTGVGTGTFRLRAINDANTDGQNAYIITRTGFAVDTHQWLTASTERMRITSGGNVGIGTSSPSYTLDVRATTGTISATSTTGTNSSYVAANNTGGITLIGRDSSSGGLTGTAYANLLYGDGSYPIIFSTNGTARMRINAGAPILCLAGGNTSATGTGIAFPATQSASSDANTLDDYEEGTWTPNQGAGLTVNGAFSSTGRYVKIGRLVYVEGTQAGATNIAVSVNGILCSNLPFSPTTGNASGIGGLTNNDLNQTSSVWVDPASTTLYAIEAVAANAKLWWSVTYYAGS